MNGRAFIPPTLVMLWVAASLGGKVWRYSDAPAPVEIRVGQAVQGFLWARGWRFSERRPLTGHGGAYKADLYVKADCAKPLIIVQLGRNDEASTLVRDRLGADVAFVAGGRAAEDPSVMGWLLSIPTQLRSAASLHLLAVSPAPPKAEPTGPCDAPSEREWNRLELPVS